MSRIGGNSGFLRPSPKELGFAVCCVLEQAGGRLTFERTAEVVGDFLKIPEDARNQPSSMLPKETDWNYCMTVTCGFLRKKGFLVKNDSTNWGYCILTMDGHELGHWARQFYNGEVDEMPDWVGAFLHPTVNRMKRLLRGGHNRKLPDYELCRWVRYCYLLNRPKLGTVIFNLILADHVDPQLYRETERQARILRLRCLDEPININIATCEIHPLLWDDVPKAQTRQSPLSINHPAWAVAAAVLIHNNGRLHYTEINDRVIATGLTPLGLRGETPSQSLGVIIRKHDKVFRACGAGYYELRNKVEVASMQEVKQVLTNLQSVYNSSSAYPQISENPVPKKNLHAAWTVAAALLIRTGRALHYLDITQQVQSSGLTTLGLRGSTPSASLRVQLRNHPDIFIMKGNGFYGICDTDRAQRLPEVHAAMIALDTYCPK